VRTWIHVSIAIVLGAAARTQAQSGGSYSLVWSSLDCGSTPSAGGNYTIRGSVGQAASGSAAGGAYALQGGATPTDTPDITDGSRSFVFGLQGNAPNPFTTTTAVAFTLPHETNAELTVYDLAGRRVRKLLDSRLPAGRHRVIWDGRDESGRRAAHGIYLLRLQAGALQAHRKLAIVQ
jgi:hypothetical protein